ncbi:hypothetical protein RirG_013760 [Rhizophagus irregularis DAOM 197198w]|uniref:Uncharacterized protein n=1 Tax=Rhizophagus irregularis (strain DAOM 197198w) TaxID=1432141 RepID=A0A015NGU4_RHIIW|nr:hypothetical protein RirG_013760 [Rhizophagus irregularis DAOM 197198w]
MAWNLADLSGFRGLDISRRLRPSNGFFFGVFKARRITAGLWLFGHDFRRLLQNFFDTDLFR